MISKELLSEVLGIRTIVMAPILEPNSKIGYLVYGSQNTIQEVKKNHKQINIYELAHKCKEWAISNGYNLWSGYAPKDKKFAVNFYLIKENIEIDCDESLADTEPEAIFKACQWILDNVKTNSLS